MFKVKTYESRSRRAFAKYKFMIPEILREAIKAMYLDIKWELMKEGMSQHSHYRHGFLGEPHFFTESISYWTRVEGDSVKACLYSTHPRAEYIVGMFSKGTRRGYVGGPIFIEIPGAKEGEVSSAGYPVKRGQFGDIGIYVRGVSKATVEPVIPRIVDKYLRKKEEYIEKIAKLRGLK